MYEKPRVKYFICALGTSAKLGIPAEQTERIIPVSRLQTSVYETENDDAFISIPALFRQKDIAAPHGLVLKGGRDDGNGKTILLTPKIDIDLEIPEENIHSFPEAFAGLYTFIKGACFSGGSQNVILILDPEKLTEVYHD